jgi:hypothetical protein
VREAGRQVERLACDDQQLDVGELVGGAARDAPGQHDLLGDGRERIRDALGELPELVAAVRGRYRSISSMR